MSTSSLLGGTQLPPQARGKDTDALGPSDNSDSGSDAQGAYGEGELASDSDAVGTGERAAVGSGREQPDADILPDRVENAGDEGEDAPDAPLFDDAADVNNLTDGDVDPADLTGEPGSNDAAADRPDGR